MRPSRVADLCVQGLGIAGGVCARSAGLHAATADILVVLVRDLTVKVAWLKVICQLSSEIDRFRSVLVRYTDSNVPTMGGGLEGAAHSCPLE